MGSKYHKIPRNVTVWWGVKPVGYNAENVDDAGSRVEVEDESLQIVSEEQFNRVQDVIESIRKKRSSSKDTVTVKRAVDEFGLNDVKELRDELKLHCGICNGEMVKNGTGKLHGPGQSTYYYCSNCDRNKKFPRESEYRQLKRDNEDDGPEPE